MLIAGIFLLILSITGFINYQKKMKNFKENGNDFKFKYYKYFGKPALGVVALLSVVFLIMGTLDDTNTTNTSKPIAATTEKQQSVATKEQITAYNDWVEKLKVPISKYETNINKFVQVLGNAKDGKITDSQAIAEMKELERIFQDEIEFEFRNVTYPNKELFTEEQNQKFWYVQGYLASAATDYGAASNAIARGIEINNEGQIKQSTEYINKANSYTDKAIENLKELQKELGIKLEKENDISIDLK